ncbi:DUF6752 domain-containing protein [Microbacterium sp. NPDC096154]|uniref:DUF6752 domain-containing protein n=1 Tax=Microbacterium sp. NPDC096154 TaxID=3155549 RepID=UPI00332C7703
MRELLRRLARKIAPTAYGKLEALNTATLTGGRIESAEAQQLRAEIDQLSRQIHEMRQDNRRVAELYDLIFDRLRDDNPLRGADDRPTTTQAD